MNKLIFTASALAAVLSTSTAFSRPLDDEILARSARAPHATNPVTTPANGDKAVAPYSLTGTPAPAPTPDAKAESQMPAAKRPARHILRHGSKF